MTPDGLLTRPFDYPASGQVRTGTLYTTGPAAGPLSAETRPAVVVVHGLFVHRGLPEIDLFCRSLAGAFDVLAVDMRGHGDGPGPFTWGIQEHRDLADAIAFLRAFYPAVGVTGFSFGGCVAIFAAALSRERDDGACPDAVCTVGTPAYLTLRGLRFRPALALRHLGMIVRRRRGRFHPGRPRPGWRRAVDLVGGVAPAPLLILHGTDDWLVHPDHARRLYEAARPPRELVLLEGGGHAEYMMAQDPGTLVSRVLDFFTARLIGTQVSFRRDTR